MIQTNNIETINSPVRQIKGKAELYNSSAIAASGSVITARNVCPKTHDVKVSVASKNILDANTIFGHQKVTELVIGDNSFTARGEVGSSSYAWDAGQLGFPYSNATNITNKGLDLKAGTTYTVSFNASIQEVGVYGNKITVIVYRLNDDSDGVAVDYQVYGLTITLEQNNRYSFSFIPSEDNKYGLCFRINNNLITISNIQVEQAADDTPFTPYLADTSTVGVKRYGKNLFNPALLLPNGTITQHGITITYLPEEDCFLFNGTMNKTTAQNIAMVGYNMVGNVGAKYTVSTRYVSGEVIKGTSSNPLVYLSEGYDTTNTTTNWINMALDNQDRLSASIYQNHKVLSRNYIRNVRFYIYPNDTFNNYKVRIQLEENSTATDYEAFKQPVDVVNGTVKSLSPIFTLVSDTLGAAITAEFNGIQKLADYTYKDALQSLTIDRTGEESKFFGFGVCQKLNVKLRDKERAITTTTASAFKPFFASGDNEYTSATFPLFYVSETHRDENTNELSITAYDVIKTAETHTVDDLGLTTPYTIKSFMEAIAAYFCLKLEIQNVNDLSVFDTEYTEPANFDGTETLREALTRIAEATQTIYFVEESRLIFKRLGAETALTITKDDYIELDSKDNRRLSAICSATELGDNYINSIPATGTTQYVRDNPFWELREDVAELVDKAVAAVGGLTINQFECSWRGNYLLEIGDKIELITKDDDIITSYVLNDVIEYNGSLSQKTEWHYEENESETPANPTNLGEALKQTFAKVDKVNKQIDIVASETKGNTSAISALQINTESISSSVSKIQEETKQGLEEVNTKVEEMNTTFTQTAEDLSISVNKLIEDGVDKITTQTGFTFDETGLTVSKSDSDITTTITDNGMLVKQGNDTVLTADKGGVKAKDLHATTYLFIGVNSRFQDYKNQTRTGCFWVGK